MFSSCYYLIEQFPGICSLLDIYCFFICRWSSTWFRVFHRNSSGTFLGFAHPARSESFHLHSGQMERKFSLFVPCSSSWITGTAACITYGEHCSTNSKRLTFTLLSSDSWKYANCNITDDWTTVLPFLETTKLHSNFPNENSLRIFWNKSFEQPPKILQQKPEICLENLKLHH